jgi:FkbM family methyltransferase
VGFRREPGPAVDYRASKAGRRQSWYGLKKHVKRFVALRLPHAGLRGIVRLAPRLRRSGRLPAPAHLEEVEGEVRGNRFVMLRPDRCIVAKELYWGGGRRPSSQDDLAVELFASAAERSAVALDIGAYTGIFTVVAARANPQLEAHAFEIVPENFRALFDNCVRNDILDRVTLHHVGVGTPGARITVPARSSGSALPDFYSRNLRFDAGARVRLVSLDSLVDRIPHGARVTMKIDVEGTEDEVLRHGQAFLDAFRPRILCEVLPGAADPSALESLLSPHGYRFHLVRDRDLLVSPRIDPDERFRDWLFLAGDQEGELAALGVPVADQSVPTR